MNAIKLFLTTAVLMTAMSASAQFANAPADTSTESHTLKKSNTFVGNTSRLFLSYSTPEWEYTEDSDYSWNFNNIGIGYTLSYPIKDKGLIFDVGATLDYLWWSELDSDYYEKSYDSYNDETTYDWEYEQSKMNYVSLSIPLSLGYEIRVSNKLAFKPYVGLNMRLGLSATMKEIDSYTDPEDNTVDNYDNRDEESENMFDDEWGMSRFNIGYHVGVDVEFGRFFVGFNYGADLGNIIEDFTQKTTSIRAGIIF